MRYTANHRGLTLVEVIAAISCIVAAAAMLLPAQQDAELRAAITMSKSNLRNMGAAHATYTSEWNGRQWTTCPDNLTTLLDEHHGEEPTTFLSSYSGIAGVPAVPLGFDLNGTHHETSRGWAMQPMHYADNCSLGSFRAFHTKPFNMYLNNKVFDPIFWPPHDYTVGQEIEEYFEDPGEWPRGGASFYFSTYCASVAAMYDRSVFRPKSEGGFQNPLSVEKAHRSPSMAQARYPDLKTHMLEHYWLVDRPSDAMPDTGGVPWFFNGGAKSSPETLFYDGHVDTLPVQRVLDSNAKVTEGGGDPLWIDDETACFSGSGYFDSYAVDQEQKTSFHVFTADGIRGRDVIDLDD